MGFLSVYSKTERINIDIGDGEDWWVDVRCLLPKGDYDIAQKALGSGQMRVSTSGTGSTHMNFLAYQMELVARSIINWNLTDEHDNVLAFTEPGVRHSLQMLPQSAFLAIYERVNDLNSPRSKKDKESFPPPNDGGSESEEDDESVTRAGVA